MSREYLNDSKKTVVSGGSSKGIGRSAPIRSVGGAARVGLSLPGGLSTPPLVKSKLISTSSQRPFTNPLAPPLQPPSHTSVSSQPPKKYQYDPYITQNSPPPPPPPAAPPTTPFSANNNSDPITSSRITPGNNDPVVMARQSSPGYYTMTPENSAELQPHIIAMPPQQNASGDHPLQNTGGAPPRQQQQQQTMQQKQQQQQQPRQPPPSIAQKQPDAPSYAQPQQQPPAPKQSSSSPIKRSKAPSSPDEEVDNFLRGDNNQSNNNQSNVKLRPTPLPTSQTPLQKCKTLVSRRAYADVIKYTNDILLGTDTSGNNVHCTYYNELMQATHRDDEGGLSSIAASASGGSTEEGELVDEETARLRQETSALMALRFISQLKLRRYVDLGKEIRELGLMPYLPDYQSDNKGRQPHIRVISGIPTMETIPPPGVPVITEASIDIISSSAKEQAQRQQSVAWKEGSLHSLLNSDTLPKWVPFGLRIIAAIQLQYNDGSSKAIDVLYDLRDRATRTDYWNTQGMEIWRSVIDNALVNTFVRKREWRMALKSLDNLLDGLDHGADREVEWWSSDSAERSDGAVSAEERIQMKELITSAAHVELLSRQLLILLQSGAIAAGETIQNDVRLHATKVESLMSDAMRSNENMTTLSRMTREMVMVRQVPIRAQLNEGLLQFARCNYTDAASCFRHALAQQRQLDETSSASTEVVKSLECQTDKDLSSPTLGFDTLPSLTVEALNNLSLCLLYLGNMRNAVQELEGLIREDPSVYLTEGIAFNLCTLYELGLDGEECTRKKRLLQRVAKRFHLHDIGVESFRLG